MHTLRTVFRKEILDNFRDRRTLLSALLMGPLFGPILFAFVINLSLKQSLSNADQPLDLPVIGADYAPNLMAFLESRNIEIAEAPADREAAMQAVLDGVQTRRNARGLRAPPRSTGLQRGGPSLRFEHPRCYRRHRRANHQMTCAKARASRSA